MDISRSEHKEVPTFSLNDTLKGSSDKHKDFQRKTSKKVKKFEATSHKGKQKDLRSFHPEKSRIKKISTPRA